MKTLTRLLPFLLFALMANFLKAETNPCTTCNDVSELSGKDSDGAVPYIKYVKVCVKPKKDKARCFYVRVGEELSTPRSDQQQTPMKYITLSGFPKKMNGEKMNYQEIKWGFLYEGSPVYSPKGIATIEEGKAVIPVQW